MEEEVFCDHKGCYHSWKIDISEDFEHKNETEPVEWIYEAEGKNQTIITCPKCGTKQLVYFTFDISYNTQEIKGD